MAFASLLVPRSRTQGCGTSFHNWADGEPDGFRGGGGFCSVLLETGEWEDEPCSWSRTYCVCEQPASLSSYFAEEFAVPAAQAAAIDRRYLSVYLGVSAGVTLVLAGAYAGWLWRLSRHRASAIGARSAGGRDDSGAASACPSLTAALLAVASHVRKLSLWSRAQRTSQPATVGRSVSESLQRAKGAQRRLRARVQGLLLLLGLVLVLWSALPILLDWTLGWPP